MISFGIGFLIMFPPTEDSNDYPEGWDIVPKVLVMFAGEEEFLNIPVAKSGFERFLQRLYFVGFIIIMVVVIMNLMNALAISDTTEMMEKAEEEKINLLLETVCFWEAPQTRILKFIKARTFKSLSIFKPDDDHRIIFHAFTSDDEMKKREVEEEEEERREGGERGTSLDCCVQWCRGCVDAISVHVFQFNKKKIFTAIDKPVRIEEDIMMAAIDIANSQKEAEESDTNKKAEVERLKEENKKRQDKAEETIKMLKEESKKRQERDEETIKMLEKSQESQDETIQMLKTTIQILKEMK